MTEYGRRARVFSSSNSSTLEDVVAQTQRVVRRDTQIYLATRHTEEQRWRPPSMSISDPTSYPTRRPGRPKVRRIEPRDCFAALAEGIDDVLEMPTYPAFVGLFYGLAGIALVSLTSFGNALHLAFPLAAGFALVGPFVAVGLYRDEPPP